MRKFERGKAQNFKNIKDMWNFEMGIAKSNQGYQGYEKVWMMDR